MSNLVEVARFIDPEEACVATSLLNARGIHTIAQNEHHLTMAPWLRVGLDGYHILCFDSESDRARRELDLATTAFSDTHLNHADRSVRTQKKNFLWLPIAFLLGVPFLLKYSTSWEFALQGAVAFIFMTLIIWNGAYY